MPDRGRRSFKREARGRSPSSGPFDHDDVFMMSQGGSPRTSTGAANEIIVNEQDQGGQMSGRLATALPPKGLGDPRNGRSNSSTAQLSRRAGTVASTTGTRLVAFTPLLQKSARRCKRSAAVIGRSMRRWALALVERPQPMRRIPDFDVKALRRDFYVFSPTKSGAAFRAWLYGNKRAVLERRPGSINLHRQ